jgi:type II secretory pathway pseudopilin PulG
MNSIANQKPMVRFRLLVRLILLVAIVSILPAALVGIRWRNSRNEQRAREFVREIVKSINQHTDFYKQHCRKRAIEDIEKNIGDITDNYEIRVLDYESAHYEYSLIFDDKNIYVVTVDRFPRNELLIIHFTPR